MPIVNNNSINAELGKNNETLYEPENDFAFDNTNSEKVIKGQNNTWIVLGRDRPSDRPSGYGGIGAKKCGAIDIVVGRLSSIDGKKNFNSRVNPSFSADGARIYLSQKTDIDTNFNLVDGMTGKTVGKSGIGIKADDIRLISRNTFKIVTGTDDKLSDGTFSPNKVGVQLIANNDDSDMQPLVKGINLETCLGELKDQLIELNGLFYEFVRIQNDFNNVVGSHTHQSPFFGLPTSPSPQILQKITDTIVQVGLKVEQGLRNNIVNTTAWGNKFLIASAPNYINSTFHYLN